MQTSQSEREKCELAKWKESGERGEGKSEWGVGYKAGQAEVTQSD